MLKSARHVAPVVIAALAATLVLSGCKEPDPFGSTARCNTRIDNATSPAPGVLTFTGMFYPDETLLLQMTQNSQAVTIASGTPATARTSLTLTGLPSGTNTFFRVVSCKGGQDKSYGTKSYFVL